MLIVVLFSETGLDRHAWGSLHYRYQSLCYISVRVLVHSSPLLFFWKALKNFSDILWHLLSFHFKRPHSWTRNMESFTKLKFVHFPWFFLILSSCWFLNSDWASGRWHECCQQSRWPKCFVGNSMPWKLSSCMFLWFEQSIQTPQSNYYNCNVPVGNYDKTVQPASLHCKENCGTGRNDY